MSVYDTATWKARLKESLAGTLAGASGIFLGHPLDTIRVRMQAQNPYRGVVETAVTTVKTEGVQGLFRGLVPPLLGSAIVTALLFSSYSQANDWQFKLRPSSEKASRLPTLREVFISGTFAGLLQCFIVGPGELIKIQLQGEKDNTRYKGAMDCAVKVVREGGPSALLRGLSATIWRDAPSFGVYFWVYEYLKRNTVTDENDPLAVPKQFAAGGAAGVLSWCTYPMDLIKARMQMDSIRSPQYKGVIDCIRQTYAEGGARIFFRGLSPTLYHAVIVNAPIFYVYELTLGALNRLDRTYL